MADEPLDVEELQKQLAEFSVDQFLLSASSTFASLAYAKLERNDLPEAKRAIDALAALAPLLEGELASDLALALAGLQVAYADAANASNA